mmetsp:Transcript_142074/g.250520  ORF Transcript_142074/g.250520 Transcript_142074/m.250520 type:complete len:974 (+) Transcript_142074:90-3011(+)
MLNQNLVLLILGAIVRCGAVAECDANDAFCAADSSSSVDDTSAHSMLNLAMRKSGKVDPQEQQLTVNSTDLQGGLEAWPNLSDEINMSVFMDKPGDKHTGLPGDVVITEVTIKCGDTVFSPMGHCPEKCPFFTQVAGKNKGCFFKCVAAAQCGSEDPKTTVPDEELGVCRQCNNIGCAQCKGGKGDECVKCAKGYSLQEDGSCASDYVFVWKGIFAFVGALLIFLVIWMIQLGLAPITNKEGLEEGLAHRSSIKLHVPIKDEVSAGLGSSEGREMFPISTNMHVTQVAGPGLTLHMNFQMASIMWCNTLIVVWLLFVYMTDPRQLTIGLLPAETPPQLCAVTMQGRSLQEDQMPFKVAFIITVYIITFVGSIAYGALNKRIFENIEDESGMEDFAAIVHGLPPIKGSDRDVEKDLKECLEKATGEKVVGVSIAWNYADKADTVEDLLDKDLISREDGEQPTPDPNVYDGRPDIQKKIFGPVDTLVGGVLGLTIPDEEEEQAVDSKEVVGMLENMNTTGSAFVVFTTEASRDKAVETMKTQDVVAFKGGVLKLKKEVFDPKVVLWENFNVSWSTLTFRMAVGIVAILVSLVVYSVCFYLPFAYYQSMFKFPNEPGAMEGLLFSMLVVAGNQIMYQICAAISDGAGFRFRDSAEALYVALYVLAVLLSVIFDMSVEFYLGYHSMADADVKTADGRSLAEMTHWQEIFESYPMQKVLGKRLFDYCFPATFTIPFLVEPIGTIVAPFTIQRWLLRTHPEVRGRNAEKSVEPFAPMDMGRYGDILLNLLLVCLIFFFPSGQILPILLTYTVSHAYIYCYDQYRILRCVPAFDYGSEEVDKYTQYMMILPCSTLAACIVFKLNCISENFCVEGWTLARLMSLAFFGHALLHLILLKTIVPIVGALHAHAQTEETYADCAAQEPCTWFNANPIHCLRSKYIQQDSPSCCYYVQGKEHLIRKNPAIGIYFEDRRKTKAEIY